MPDSELTVERSEVLRYLGYRGQALTPELEAQIDDISRLCLEAAQPRSCFEVFPVEPGPALNGVRLFGEDIRKHLTGATHCAVMAATLGFEVERVMLRLGKRSTVSEMIFNAACTALIEAAADECDGRIRDYARARGLVTGYRYSPGYGDFPLEQQRAVLGLIAADTRLGITLTDSLLMLPKKSVSALVGLYPEELGVKRGGSSCERCENRDSCAFRKEGYGCGG